MKPFSIEGFLKTAQQQTGLSDFGPADFMEGFTVFINSINAQGEIGDQHREKFEERILRLLMNRLWFAGDLAEHPEITNEDVASPVVIVSLPRTGSTKLHRMLGASGDFQSLLLWKAHMFARIPDLADGGRAQRIQATRDYEKWMYEVSPEVLTGHPMFTDEPDEDQLLGEFTFHDSYCSGVFNVPAHMQWLMQADMQPRFDYYLQQIKYLQWQEKLLNPSSSARPWLLKSPIHLGSESDLSNIFKTPRFIFTHRDPVKCMPSIANPVRYMRKMYSDHDTAASLGTAMTGLFGYKAMEHMKWRDANPDVQVLDLSMQEITRDGMGTAQKVYDFLGMPLSPAAKTAIQLWEQNNGIEKHGKNVYTAEGVGTTDDDIGKAFAPYIERYSKYL
jgi:Sulfotransferase family